MATFPERLSTIIVADSPSVLDFLNEMTQLCQKYGLGLTGGTVLFVMEREDYSRVFSVNAESELTFA